MIAPVRRPEFLPLSTGRKLPGEEVPRPPVRGREKTRKSSKTALAVSLGSSWMTISVYDGVYRSTWSEVYMKTSVRVGNLCDYAMMVGRSGFMKISWRNARTDNDLIKIGGSRCRKYEN